MRKDFKCVMKKQGCIEVKNIEYDYKIANEFDIQISSIYLNKAITITK